MAGNCPIDGSGKNATAVRRLVRRGQASWPPRGIVAGLCGILLCGILLCASLSAQEPPPAAGAAAADGKQAPATLDNPDDRSRVAQLAPPPGREQKLTAQAWDYIPYRVLVWIVDDNTRLIHDWFPAIRQQIERDARLEEYNAWSVECRHADPLWNYRLDSGLEQPTAAWTAELADRISAEDFDKLIAIRVVPEQGQFRLVARELDLMTRQWGQSANLDCGQIEWVPARAYAALRQAFMPLTRVERISDKTIYCRMRAVSLCRTLAYDEAGTPREVPAEDSPVWVRKTDVLLPVIRRNNRDNQFSSVEIADLTFLAIESQIESVLKCYMYTAQWAPLSGRTGSRTQKFAVVVRPQGVDTKLTLYSNEPKNPAPLSGLGVYLRTPANPELPEQERKTLEKNSEVWLGKSDWKGSIRIPPAADGGVRLVYVKNGKKELKMVPVMPGLFPTLRAPVQDDKARVYAEGVANGWKNRILDFVARRTILEHRLTTAIENKEFEKARKIHDNDYKRLQAFEASFDYLLKESKRQLLSRKDANERQRELIDTMFNNLESVIAKNVKPTGKQNLFDQILNKDSGESEEDLEESPPAEGAPSGGGKLPSAIADPNAPTAPPQNVPATGPPAESAPPARTTPPTQRAPGDTSDF